MTDVLVDSNVILDIVTEDPQWLQWSATHLAECANQGTLMINPIIYAEVSIAFEQVTELDEALLTEFFDVIRYPGKRLCWLAEVTFNVVVKEVRGDRPCPIFILVPMRLLRRCFF